jgi:hypothetical protein
MIMGLEPLRAPLKAVALVRIPSGLPGKPPLTRPGITTSSQHLLGSTVGDARGTQELPPVLPSTRARSADFACRNMGSNAGGVVLSRGWTSSGTARRPGTTRLDDQASLQAEGATRYVGDHQARAIRLKDAGRRQKLAIAGAFRLRNRRASPHPTPTDAIRGTNAGPHPLRRLAAGA